MRGWIVMLATAGLFSLNGCSLDTLIKNLDDDYDEYDERYDDDRDDYGSYVPVTWQLPQGYTPDEGRLLGSQCAQCHGTNGISVTRWDGIAGEDDNLYSEMYEYGPGHIMRAQAQGYTLQEIGLIERWLRSLGYRD